MKHTPHYKPHLSRRPIVAVRWRSVSRDGHPKRTWRLFLFGLVPIASLPRSAEVSW